MKGWGGGQRGMKVVVRKGYGITVFKSFGSEGTPISK